MRTIEIKVPEPVLRQARELADQENIALEQLLTLAVTQGIGFWTAERNVASDTRSRSRKRFLEMLQQALDSDTPALDRVPPA